MDLKVWNHHHEERLFFFFKEKKKQRRKKNLGQVVKTQMYFPRKHKNYEEETVTITLLITCKKRIGVTFQVLLFLEFGLQVKEWLSNFKE